MTFSDISESLLEQLSGPSLTIIGAVALLLVGWLLALGVRFVVRRALGLLDVNRRIETLSGSAVDVERFAGLLAFWIVVTLALIAFFNALQLSQASRPLTAMAERVLIFLPQLIAAGVTALGAWLIALLLRTLVTRLLKSTSLDERLSATPAVPAPSESLGQVAFGLVLLLFLPAVLDILELEGLLAPVQGVVTDVLGLLPNLAAAVVLGLVGWVVARILSNLVSSLLAATGIDAFGQRMGLKSKIALSSVIGTLVFVFVFVPTLVGALDALGVEAVARPASQMLGTFMQAIPNLFAAALVLIIAFLIGRFIAEVAARVLEGVGFDRVPQALGVPSLLPARISMTVAARRLILAAVLLFAGVEAAEMLGFNRTSQLATVFIGFAGQVLLGIAILGLGVWLANLAYEAAARLSRTTALAGAVRVVLIALVFAMGLRAMGVAEDIVTLAFALPLGAVALAVAISFGIGGRDVAARRLEQWTSRLDETTGGTE